jgi:FtsZ-binding cell division protein ZapB
MGLLAMNENEKRKYKKDETPSAVRKKAKQLENSRDDWKEKHQEKQASIKALKARMDETKASRENWKLRSLQYENDATFHKKKVERLEEELIKERIEKAYLLNEIEELKKKSNNF